MNRVLPQCPVVIFVVEPIPYGALVRRVGCRGRHLSSIVGHRVGSAVLALVLVDERVTIIVSCYQGQEGQEEEEEEAQDFHGGPCVGCWCLRNEYMYIQSVDYI